MASDCGFSSIAGLLLRRIWLGMALICKFSKVNRIKKLGILRQARLGIARLIGMTISEATLALFFGIDEAKDDAEAQPAIEMRGDGNAVSEGASRHREGILLTFGQELRATQA